MSAYLQSVQFPSLLRDLAENSSAFLEAIRHTLEFEFAFCLEACVYRAFEHIHNDLMKIKSHCYDDQKVILPEKTVA